MTYRGVYRDGIVILQGDVDLRNGDSVEVNATPARKPKAEKKSASGTNLRRGKVRSSSPKRTTAKHPLPGFGAWKGRTDIGDTAEFARALRKRTSTRGRRSA